MCTSLAIETPMEAVWCASGKTLAMGRTHAQRSAEKLSGTELHGVLVLSKLNVRLLMGRRPGLWKIKALCYNVAAGERAALIKWIGETMYTA